MALHNNSLFDRVLTYLLLTSILILLPLSAAIGAPGISAGQLEIDSSTVHTLGFSLPISGDDNYNASVSVSYRKVGPGAWKQGLPLMRVRPETIGNEDPPENFGLPRPGEQFAGSVLDWFTSSITPLFVRSRFGRNMAVRLVDPLGF
jgi:hypothetical protein